MTLVLIGQTLVFLGGIKPIHRRQTGSGSISSAFRLFFSGSGLPPWNARVWLPDIFVSLERLVFSEENHRTIRRRRCCFDVRTKIVPCLFGWSFCWIFGAGFLSVESFNEYRWCFFCVISQDFSRLLSRFLWAFCVLCNTVLCFVYFSHFFCGDLDVLIDHCCPGQVLCPNMCFFCTPIVLGW